MKRIIIVMLATVAFSTALHAQSLDPPVVTISTNQFEFSPSEITLKRGELVTLQVISTDRIHSFHSKELGVNVEITPNQPREVTLLPENAGRFVVTGSAHGEIKLIINIE